MFAVYQAAADGGKLAVVETKNPNGSTANTATLSLNSAGTMHVYHLVVLSVAISAQLLC